MEASEYFSEPQPAPDRFDVWVEKTPNTYFEVGPGTGNWRPLTNFAPTQYLINRNDEAFGLLHCDVADDNQEAHVDGIDVHPGVEAEESDLGDDDWQSIAVCVHGLTKVRRVNHPAGQTPFLEAI
jgi:hypothetical protein